MSTTLRAFLLGVHVGGFLVGAVARVATAWKNRAVGRALYQITSEESS